MFNFLLKKICRECGCNKFLFEFTTHRAECKVCRQKIEKNKKINALEYLGRHCDCCGYDGLRCPKAMEFHHVTTSEKEMARERMRYLPIDKRNEELNKCVSLCARCHREVHDGLHKDKELIWGDRILNRQKPIIVLTEVNVSWNPHVAQVNRATDF